VKIQPLKRTPQADMPSRDPDYIIGAVVAVFWVVMVILVNPIGDFPLNDDWIYGGAAQLLVNDGDFRIPGPTIANALSQSAWGALFCLPSECSYTVLRLSTLTLGLVGVLALYACVREIGGSVGTALLASATLGVNPLYFGLANSFMTDVPFTSMGIVAIYFFARGFRRQSQIALAVGVLASFAALLDRQVAIVLLLGFAMAYPIRFGWKFGTVLKAVVPLGVGLALHVAYQHWLTSTGRAPGLLYSTASDLRPASLLSFVALSLKLAARSAPYVGLFVLPLTVLLPAGPPREGGGRQDGTIHAASAAFALGLFCMLWWWGRALPQMGNVLIESGLGPASLRGILPAWPPASQTIETIWLVITALGCFSVYRILRIAVPAAKRLTHRGQPGTPMAWLHAFLAAVLASYWALTSLLVHRSNAPFDRYLLFIVPVLAIWLILSTSTPGPGLEREADGPPRPLTAAIAIAVIIGFGAFSVAATHDFLAWNRARWAATDHLMHEEHIQPQRIDGGYEFNGHFLYDRKYTATLGKSWWWVVDDEYVIATADLPGYQRIGDYPYGRWLPPYGMSVVVLHRVEPPPVPSAK
jgi:hypothetical protein